MIVELWITIHGFGFTSTWMERYNYLTKSLFKSLRPYGKLL